MALRWLACTLVVVLVFSLARARTKGDADAHRVPASPGVPSTTVESDAPAGRSTQPSGPPSEIDESLESLDRLFANALGEERAGPDMSVDGAPEEAGGDWPRYEQYGPGQAQWVIDHPADWTAEPHDNGVLLRSPIPGAAVSVAALAASGEPLMELAEAHLGALADKVEEMEVLDLREEEIEGTPAVVADVRYRDPDVGPADSRLIWITDQMDTVYLLTVDVADVVPAAEFDRAVQVALSFRFTVADEPSTAA